MKTRIKKQIKYATLIGIFLISGCSGFFDNPIKDKNTGEDINLLIIDFNFFNTRVTYKFVDAKEGFLITAPATVTFSGKNANDIVNYGGNKNQSYATSVGQIELTLDPNVDFSETNPFEFAINVKIDGYTPMSKGVQFRKVGIKTVEVQLSKITDQEENNLNGDLNTDGDEPTFVFMAPYSNGLKSAKADPAPYIINRSITLGNLIKFKDQSGNLIFPSIEDFWNAYNASANPDSFIVLTPYSFSSYSPWIDVLNVGGSPQSVIFHILQTGGLSRIVVNGITVGSLGGGIVTATATYTGSPTPDYFGFAEFAGGGYTITGSNFNFTSLNDTYILAKASAEILCASGTSLTFNCSKESSFSITADVYDRQDPPQLITVLNFAGNFPETFVVENTPPIPVTLKFRDTNPSFQHIPDLEIDNFCTGNATINVVPETGYLEYQIVLKAYCPSNPTIAVAPTYNAEFRMAGTTDLWQGVSMLSGVVNLLGKPNQEYEYRLLWNSEWEYTTIWTEFDASGNYTHLTDSRSITSELLPDGRIRIHVDSDFKQSVCDDLGW